MYLGMIMVLLMALESGILFMSLTQVLYLLCLANGHLAALKKLATMENNYDVFNLGTGKGHSVLEVLKGFQTVLGKEVPHKIAERRTGDLPRLVANVDKVSKELDWKAVKSLEDMCRDTLTFANKRYKKQEKKE